MPVNFEKTINISGKNKDFFFKEVFFGNEIIYHIQFIDDSNKLETFRMKKDESGQFKILAQKLPLWIHENDLLFSDIIHEERAKK